MIAVDADVAADYEYQEPVATGESAAGLRSLSRAVPGRRTRLKWFPMAAGLALAAGFVAGTLVVRHGPNERVTDSTEVIIRPPARDAPPSPKLQHQSPRPQATSGIEPPTVGPSGEPLDPRAKPINQRGEPHRRRMRVRQHREARLLLRRVASWLRLTRSSARFKPTARSSRRRSSERRRCLFPCPDCGRQRTEAR